MRVGAEAELKPESALNERYRGNNFKIPTDEDHPALPDYDGVPQSAAASNGPLRRLVKVALLQCVADGINGHGTYPTYGRYVMMFITQEVRDPPDAAIYGEIVRPLSPINEPTFHANVKLVK